MKKIKEFLVMLPVLIVMLLSLSALAAYYLFMARSVCGNDINRAQKYEQVIKNIRNNQSKIPCKNEKEAKTLAEYFENETKNYENIQNIEILNIKNEFFVIIDFES